MSFADELRAITDQVDKEELERKELEQKLRILEYTCQAAAKKGKTYAVFDKRLCDSTEMPPAWKVFMKKHPELIYSFAYCMRSEYDERTSMIVKWKDEYVPMHYEASGPYDTWEEVIKRH